MELHRQMASFRLALFVLPQKRLRLFDLRFSSFRNSGWDFGSSLFVLPQQRLRLL
jgi:hypothetical protein